MGERNVFLRCSHCGVINRIPAGRLMDRPRCGRCKNPLEFPFSPVDATAATFEKEVISWPGVALVEFWAPWWGHCRVVAPVVEAIARRRAGFLKVAKVNIDNEPSLGRLFGIHATPTFIVYRNGNKLDEIPGAIPKEDLEAWIDSFLTG